LIVDRHHVDALGNTALQLMANSGIKNVRNVMFPIDNATYRHTFLALPNAKETRETLGRAPPPLSKLWKSKSTRPAKILPAVEMLDDDDDDEGEVCPACRRTGHNIKTCAWPNHDGVVRGCPLCNKADHLVDECDAWRALEDLERLEVLTDHRANMPCLETRMDWILFVKNMFDQSPDLRKERGFPWTAAFGKMARDSKPILAGVRSYYNFSLDSRQLPGDPATSTFRDFMKMAAEHVAALGEVMDESDQVVSAGPSGHTTALDARAPAF
jgi:hypothetical protein